ncbi:MAG: putative Ig domain-containing protein, partial [Chloroflexota bacterium]
GHAYADEATQTVTATVYPKGDTPTSASAASDQGTLTVGEADVLADNSPMAIQASTGQQFSGPVATFTDSGYPSNSASDFTATIGWGDTTSSAGTVTSDGAGDFTVSGQHIYSAPGLETGSVSITDDSPGTASSTTSFTATVNEPPAITSANHATFTAGVAGSFTVTATGSPTPSIAETGGLPSGVTFTDNGNGTATLSGTPAAGTGGTYSISIKATNGASPRAIQSFVLTVVGVSASVTTGPGTVSGSTSCNYASGSSCRQSYNSYLNCLGRAGALNCRGTLIAKTPASFHSRTITTAGVASGQAYMSGTGVLTGVGFVPFSAAFVDNGPGQNGTAVLTINGVTTEYVCRGACNIIRTR